MLLEGIKVLLNRPLGNRVHNVFLQRRYIAILNDASHGNVRQGKALSHVLYAARLDPGLFKWLAGVVDNALVRMDSAGGQFLECLSLTNGDLHVDNAAARL